MLFLSRREVVLEFEQNRRVEKANDKLALIMSVTEMCVLERKELHMTWYLWTIELTFRNRDVQLYIKYSSGLLTEH